MLQDLTKVLDKGEIEVIDYLGSDLTAVNAARVSFGKKKYEFDSKDEALLKYLKEHKHYSPFRHIMVQFRIKAPEFVMRQWYKHVVGIETTSSYPTKDHGWNEISGRYTEIKEYYTPKEWRAQSDDNKQASSGTIDEKDVGLADTLFNQAMGSAEAAYRNLIKTGVSRELARIVMPLNIYTEVYWTASFQAIMNFLELRDHEHAQYEIREYAVAMKKIMLELFPNTTSIWLAN